MPYVQIDMEIAAAVIGIRDAAVRIAKGSTVVLEATGETIELTSNTEVLSIDAAAGTAVAEIAYGREDRVHLVDAQLQMEVLQKEVMVAFEILNRRLAGADQEKAGAPETRRPQYRRPMGFKWLLHLTRARERGPSVFSCSGSLSDLHAGALS